jgi:hypothetical protein
MQTVPAVPLHSPVPALVLSGRADGWLERNGVTLVCAMALFCASVLSKVSVPPFGERGIGIALFLLPLTACVGFAAGLLQIHPVRLALFLMLAGVLSITSLFGVAEFSISSMAMLVVLHLPFVFAGNPSARAHETPRIHEFFLNLALIIGVCGMAQFFLQSVVPVRWLFPMESFIPPAFLMQHFNSQGVLEYGSSTYRATGVFLPEPSYFSQLMGIAIVLELCTLGRWLRLALYGVALLTAGAGTGVMIVALCVPLLLIRRGRWDFLLLGVAALAALVAFGSSTYVGHLASRAGEFDAVGSSAFARFIGGFYLFDQFLWDDPVRTLFGFGAGSFSEYAARAHYSVAEMPLFKMVLEFGLLGALSYFLVLGYFLFSSPAPRILVLAILVAFLLNGIYAVFAQALALGLLIWPFSPATGQRL